MTVRRKQFRNVIWFLLRWVGKEGTLRYHKNFLQNNMNSPPLFLRSCQAI